MTKERKSTPNGSAFQKKRVSKSKSHQVLERSLERPRADLHDIHALGSGIDLLLAPETASRANNIAKAIEHGDGLALSIGDYDVVVRGPIYRNKAQARIHGQGLRA